MSSTHHVYLPDDAAGDIAIHVHVPDHFHGTPHVTYVRGPNGAGDDYSAARELAERADDIANALADADNRRARNGRAGTSRIADELERPIWSRRRAAR